MEFSCEAVEADLLFFFVNNDTAAEQCVMDEGFIQCGAETDTPTTRRNLTATALTQYNNTEIKCVAGKNINDNPKYLFSDTGILLVQGKLL